MHLLNAWHVLGAGVGGHALGLSTGLCLCAGAVCHNRRWRVGVHRDSRAFLRRYHGADCRALSFSLHTGPVRFEFACMCDAAAVALTLLVADCSAEPSPGARGTRMQTSHNGTGTLTTWL